MWQNILVIAILAMAGGFTLWRFYKSFTGKASCCSGGCSCKGSCSSNSQDASDLKVLGNGGQGAKQLRQLTGVGCGCAHGAGG